MVRLKSPDESVHLNPHDRPNTASEEKILTDRIIQTVFYRAMFLDNYHQITL